MGWDAELAVALEAADAAVVLLRGRPTTVDHKDTVDLVTDVDRAVEAAVRRVLRAHFPDVPVLGEETPDPGAEAAHTRWIVDPLDGTTNFVHGFPWYACSVALEVDGQVVVGIVADPIRDLRFTATRGGGAWCGGRPLAVSTTDTLARALLGTGFPYDRAARAESLLRPFRQALENTRGVRRAGAASLDLATLAAGGLDGFWEHDLAPWDVAAGNLLITEAGGRVTRLGGVDLPGPITSPLASNGVLHDALADLLEPR